MTTYKATHSDSSAGIDKAVKAGIEWIQAFSEGLVIAPTLNHFKDYPLRAHPQLKTITDQYNKTSYTKFWPSYTGKSKIILACWPEEEELDKLDCLDGLQEMCVVSWTGFDVRAWRMARQPIELIEVERLPQPQLDPTVERAMLSLTDKVNLKINFDPLFSSITISLFQKLKVGGYEWEPHMIKAWAMINNWTAPNAQNLREIATGVQDGSIYPALSNDWPKDILQQWETPD